MFEKKFSSNLYELYSFFLLEGREFPHQSSGNFRPSEARVRVGDNVLGCCGRKIWYRLKHIQPSNVETLPHQIERMNVGKSVENSFIENCKRIGIYVDNNIAFTTTMNGITISGELDAILRTSPCGKEKYILECKSFYGMYAEKQLLGSLKKPYWGNPSPKDSYVMQLALYLNHFSKLPEDHPSYIPFGAIFAEDRGDGYFNAFNLWLEESQVMRNDDEVVPSTKIVYNAPHAKVDRVEIPYTTEDILDGYREVQKALSKEDPPPRDFIKEYNRDQVESKFKEGSISKSAYQKWISSHGPRGQGKETLGDWNCRNLYCAWSDLCWSSPE